MSPDKKLSDSHVLAQHAIPVPLTSMSFRTWPIVHERTRVWRVLAVVVAFGLFATSTNADTVSINIADGTHPVGDGAGVVPANHWNNLNYQGTTTFTDLEDSKGAETTLKLSVMSGDRRVGATGPNADVNTDLYWGFTAFIATDNLPSKNFAFGPNTAYLLENLNATFPRGYDVYLYTQMWSFGTGTGSDIVVDDNSDVFGRGYNGHGPAWTGSVANLGLNMTNQAYDANEGFVEGDNFVKLLDLNEDTLNFQPYPNFGPHFNSVGITGIQIVGAGPEPQPTTFQITPHDVGLPDGVQLVGGAIRTNGEMGEGLSFSDLEPTFQLELTNGETTQILTELDATIAMSVDEPLFDVTEETITFVPGEGQFIRFTGDEAPFGGLFWSGESPHDSGLLAVEVDGVSEITTPPPIGLGNFAVRASGDANGDGIVDAADLALVLANWSTGDTYATGDFNGDDTVDVADLSRLFDSPADPAIATAAAHYAAVPEPSTWVLALFGLMGLLGSGRRRHQRIV
jgi:hypothetical protein